MEKIVMYNPKNSITIETISKLKKSWENLGFIEITKVRMFPAI